MTKEDFRELCHEAEFGMSNRQIDEFFVAAVGHKENLEFEDFCMIMKRENYF